MRTRLIAAAGVALVALAAAACGTSDSSVPTQAPNTVTYIVSGSNATVTYGPAGSNLSGSVPMDKTSTIPAAPPVYYSITAQLQGGGTVSCKIKVDGQVISSATASGGYNIASCEIGQDPISGDWQNDNSA